MKTNTFILIVSVYGTLLGILSLFFPSIALEYFAGEPHNVQQHSLTNFLGLYQIVIAYIGFALLKSTDGIARRAWLLATAFLTILAIILIFYNKSVRMLPVSDTYLVDIAIWAAIAIGALFYRSKE